MGLKKECDNIISEHHRGELDKKNNKKYSNPYSKQKDKHKYRAYKNGYYGCF